jgi:predicted RNA-binding protein with RPS1 domain
MVVEKNIAAVEKLTGKKPQGFTDVVKEGDEVQVKLMAIDDRGRMNLSIKEASRK